jgi:hypothetical protein
MTTKRFKLVSFISQSLNGEVNPSTMLTDEPQDSGVRVLCRFRPVSTAEAADRAESKTPSLSLSETSVQVVSTGAGPQQFAFDRVFDSASTQVMSWRWY